MPKFVPIGDLFEVGTGHGLALDAQKRTDPDEGVAFVGRSHRNNGVTGWIEPITGVDPSPPGCISVALRSRNHPLASFVQPREFYTAYHVAVLTPKRPMSLATKLWYCECIEANRFRFNFGRQANRTLPTLPIPAAPPAWVSGVTYERASTTPRRAVTALHADRWPEYLLGDLFDLHPGRFVNRRDLAKGDTPFITASDANNGVTKWVGLDLDWPGGQITVANNGSVGAAFYQPRPFVASRDVTILEPRFPMTPASALFICTVIRLEAFRFNYARKWNTGRMRRSKIRLPTKSGKPDTGRMEAYLHSVRLGELLDDDPGAKAKPTDLDQRRRSRDFSQRAPDVVREATERHEDD